MKKFIKEHKLQFDRFVDILPVLLTVFAFILLVLGSIYYPAIVGYSVTAYIVYYAFETGKITVLSYRAYLWLKENRKINWLKKVKKSYSKEFEKFQQVVIIPFVREPETILRPTLDNLLASNFPNEKIILVLAPEAAYPVGIKLAKKLEPEYKEKFGKFFIFEHTLLPGELKGKSSNENNAARKLYKVLTAEGYDPKDVLVTSLDSDMLPDKEFLPMLTYHFFKEGKNRFMRIFQPLPVNMMKAWGSIPPARLIASFGFQFYSALMQMPKRLINFSVYSSSLKMVRAVNYWSPDVIPEDERYYWQAYFTYGEKLKIVPLYIPVYGDIIIGDSIWDAIVEQYKQIRRWAWGATEIKYFLYHAIMHTEIPWSAKLYKLVWRFRTHFEWVFIPVILSFGTLFPSLFSEEYRRSTLAYLIPMFSSRVLSILLGMFVILLALDNYYAPKKPKGWKLYQTIWTYISWIMFPIVSFFFAAIPAFEAQLRMLLKKPIVYIETKKK